MSKLDKSKMPCNKPRSTPGAKKAFAVKGCQNGEEKIVRFGAASGYGRNYSAKARKNFRARHNCESAKDKTTAKYWSCKKWTASAPKKPKPGK
jgi:hypothetical protein